MDLVLAFQPAGWYFGAFSDISNCGRIVYFKQPNDFMFLAESAEVAGFKS
jgi:hypothetical protein